MFDFMLRVQIMPARYKVARLDLWESWSCDRIYKRRFREVHLDGYVIYSFVDSMLLTFNWLLTLLLSTLTFLRLIFYFPRSIYSHNYIFMIQIYRLYNLSFIFLFLCLFIFFACFKIISSIWFKITVFIFIYFQNLSFWIIRFFH